LRAIRDEKKITKSIDSKMIDFMKNAFEKKEKLP
jgi:hypothetical protein